jgi:hypothetical protein
VAPGWPGGGQQDEPGNSGRQQDREDQLELVAGEPAGEGAGGPPWVAPRPGQLAAEPSAGAAHGAHRVPLPGRRVARRAVGHREHQVGVAVELTRGDQLRGGVQVVGDVEPAEHVVGGHVRALGDVQRLAGQPHVPGRVVAERGLDQGRPGQLAARQHAAVPQQRGDVLTEPPVLGADDDAQVGVELLGAQGGVEVGQVVPADERRRAGRRHARLAERAAGQLRALEHGHPGERAHPRPVVLRPVRDHDHDGLVVPARQLPADSVGEGGVTADDEMIPG